MDKEEFEKHGVEIRNSKGLVISRIPKPTRDEFVAFAEAEFSDDYGLCLKYVWDMFKLSQTFFQTYDIQVKYLIEKVEALSEPKQEKKPDGQEITMMSGRKVERGFKKNEQIK